MSVSRIKAARQAMQTNSKAKQNKKLGKKKPDKIVPRLKGKVNLTSTLSCIPFPSHTHIHTHLPQFLWLHKHIRTHTRAGEEGSGQTQSRASRLHFGGGEQQAMLCVTFQRRRGRRDASLRERPFFLYGTNNRPLFLNLTPVIPKLRTVNL